VNVPTDHGQSPEETGPAGESTDLHTQVATFRADVLERLDRIERELAEVRRALAGAVRREDIPSVQQIVDDISRRLGLR
jgi:hypothetical protein